MWSDVIKEGSKKTLAYYIAEDIITTVRPIKLPPSANCEGKSISFVSKKSFGIHRSKIERSENPDATQSYECNDIR
jgi:hypothetical protein